MKEWPEVQLGSCCEVFSGHPFKSAEFTEDPEDIALIKGENVGQGEILWEVSKRCAREDAEELVRYRLKGDDVVLAMDRPWVPAGLKFARIRESDPEALLVQRVARLRAIDGLDQKFLYYIIASPEFVAYVKNVGRGVGVPHISGKQIGEHVFRLPPSQVQQRIGDILSSYDDLIENNRRRMALLEEAARQLYREWFVRLRFPGHEHTRISKGVPKGWEGVLLGDRATLNYGKALKAEDRTDGQCPVYGSSGIVGSHDKPLAQAPGIVVGRKGNVGSVYWCPKDYWPIDTVYFIDTQTSNLWLFYALQHMHFISTDVAVPGLNREFAQSRPLLVPEPRIVREFLNAAAPMHEQITKLDETNERLRAARDLLLPRLVSGKIAV